MPAISSFPTSRAILLAACLTVCPLSAQSRASSRPPAIAAAQSSASSAPSDESDRRECKRYLPGPAVVVTVPCLPGESTAPVATPAPVALSARHCTKIIERAQLGPLAVEDAEALRRHC